MAGPILWGPNNTSNNLQNQLIQSTGSLLAWNGPKNYIGYGHFENGATTGWSLAHSALSGTTPTSVATAGNAFSATSGGSSASANLSTSVVTSGSQLAGLYSLSLVSSASSTAGDLLISQAYTIDVEDKNRTLAFTLFYKGVTGTMNFSGTSSNSFAIYIYDVANAAWIQPVGVYGMTAATGTVGYVSGSFTAPSNMTQFQIALININAITGAYSLYLDDVFVGPPVTNSSFVTVALKATGNTASAINGTVTAVNNTVVYDTHSAYNSSTGVYTVPFTGYYSVTAQYAVAGGFTPATTSFFQVKILQNGSAVNPFGNSWGNGGTNNQPLTILTTVLKCSAGDTISYTLTSNGSFNAEPTGCALTIKGEIIS